MDPFKGEVRVEVIETTLFGIKLGKSLLIKFLIVLSSSFRTNY